VLATDGLVRGHLDAGRSGDGSREVRQPRQVDDLDVVAVPEGHGDLLQGDVAGPLADPVDGGVDQVRAGRQAREDVGHRQAEVVVGVGARRTQVGEPAHHLVGVLGAGVADGVTVADPVGSRVERRRQQPLEERRVGPGAVLAEHLDPQAVVAGVLDELDGRRDDLASGRADLALDVAVARRHHEVDPVDPTVQRQVDVVPNAPAEARDPGIQREIGHPVYRLAFALAGGGTARFDHVHADTVEAACQLDLPVDRQRDPWRLFAVPQCRVQ